jgi:hypothetical protein
VSPRRALWWALVAALCVAALTAIGAVVSGDFDDTDAQVILTSLGFAVFSATAASGAPLRTHRSASMRALGLATMALSGAAFALLVVALWREFDGGEDAWRLWGVASIAALACSHASLVTRARREGDSSLVDAVALASIALGTVDGMIGMAAVSGALDEVDEGHAQLLAVLVILLLLTTALPPILRRVQPPAVTPPRDQPALPLHAEVLATLDRIEALSARAGPQGEEIRRECERLRERTRSRAS